MADMPTWLIIVLAVIFFAPIVGGLLIFVIDAFFEIDGPHPQGDDKPGRDNVICGGNHNCGGCGD